MPYDLIIRGGRVVLGGDIVETDIAIDDGVIAMIGPQIARGGKTEIDATDLLVMPGLIDPHVHFNEPGRGDWEGFATGSSALAAGGGTCFFEMPLNASPPTLDAASFDLKLAAASKSSFTDFAIWGGLTPGNLDRMDELAERGAIGFKAFMSGSGIDDFERADDQTLWEGMNRAADLRLPVAVHAENDTITAALAQRAIATGKTSARDYLDSRPVIAELEAIQRAIFFAGETGCALHIVHVSSAEGVALVTAAARDGVDVTCETCGHYLLLCDKDVEAIGAAAKCAPPLRTSVERENLWAELLLGGGIDFVSSDHSPSPGSMKSGQDFFKIWGGINGCQSTLVAMLTEGYARRDLPIERIARLTSAAVAERFHLPRKGQLKADCDADLTLIDLRENFTLSADDLLYRHKISPYVGRQFTGRVKRTLLRGRTVFANGKIVGEPNGRLIKPASPKDS